MKETYVPKAVRSHVTWLQEQIDGALERCDVTPLRVIEGMFPEGEWCMLVDAHLEYTMPMCFDLIHLVRNVMAFAFPDYELSFDHQFIWDNSKLAGHFLHYQIDGKYEWQFSMAFRSEKEGATCVLTKIGVKEAPVYEVTCAEGAAEGVFDSDG